MQTNDHSKAFFDLFSSDQAARDAIKHLIEGINARGPLSRKQIEELIKSEKGWANILEKLGKNARAIVIEKIQSLNVDADMRYYASQMIDDINRRGPLSESDYDKIKRKELPERLSHYKAPAAIRPASTMISSAARKRA